MLFIDEIFKNCLRQKAGPSIRFKTRSRIFQALVRWAFETLKKNQKLDQEFENFVQTEWLKSLTTCFCFTRPMVSQSTKVKKMRILCFLDGVFFGPYFSAFGLNTERYEVSLRIPSECGKIRTTKNFVFGHFSHSDYFVHHAF